MHRGFSLVPAGRVVAGVPHEGRHVAPAARGKLGEVQAEEPGGLPVARPFVFEHGGLENGVGLVDRPAVCLADPAVDLQRLFGVPEEPAVDRRGHHQGLGLMPARFRLLDRLLVIRQGVQVFPPVEMGVRLAHLPRGVIGCRRRGRGEQACKKEEGDDDVPGFHAAQDGFGRHAEGSLFYLGSQLPVFLPSSLLLVVVSEQAVSRVLFPPSVTLRGAMIITLGRQLPAASSDLPGSSGGPPSNAPLCGLAPDGVCRASPVTRGTGELLPRLFTLTPRRARGGMFSVALSLGSPPVAVSDHPALWSSDFPPAR